MSPSRLGLRATTLSGRRAAVSSPGHLPPRARTLDCVGRLRVATHLPAAFVRPRHSIVDRASRRRGSRKPFPSRHRAGPDHAADVAACLVDDGTGINPDAVAILCGASPFEAFPYVGSRVASPRPLPSRRQSAGGPPSVSASPRFGSESRSASLDLRALLHRRVRCAARCCHHALLVAPMGLRCLPGRLLDCAGSAKPHHPSRPEGRGRHCCRAIEPTNAAADVVYPERPRDRQRDERGRPPHPSRRTGAERWTPWRRSDGRVPCAAD